MRSVLPLITGLILAFTLAQTTAQAVDTDVFAVGFAFAPVDITIDAGDTVTWHDLNLNHNVAESNTAGSDVYNGTGFYSGAPGSITTWPRTFSTPGTYYYVCEPHAVSFAMKGSVTVNAVAVPASSRWGMITSVLFVVGVGVLTLSFRSNRKPSLLS